MTLLRSADPHTYRNRNKVITTIHTYEEANAYLGRKNDRPAPHGTSVRIVRELVAPDTISVVYHQTPVVTFHADGAVTIWANGWATKTTVNVIETYFPSLSLDVVRYANGRSSRTRRTVNGIDLIGQDRSGRGDALVVRWRRTGETYVLPAERVAHLGANGSLTPVDSELPMHDCRCRICRTGATSWQEAVAIERYNAREGGNVFAR